MPNVAGSRPIHMAPLGVAGGRLPVGEQGGVMDRSLCRVLQLGECVNVRFFLEMVMVWRGGVWLLRLLVDKWTFAIPPFPHHQSPITNPLQLQTWKVFLFLSM